MLSFFVIVTLVLCSMHAYLWVKLRYLFSSPQGRLLLLIFLIVMLGLILMRRRGLYAVLPDFVPWVAYIWLGFTVIAFCCFLAYDVLRTLLFVARLFSGHELLAFFSPRSFTPVVVLIAVALAGYAMFEARNVTIKRFSVTTSKDIGGETLRIVAVSDLHISETIGASDVARWAEMITAEQPDLLVVVGDIIDTDMSKRDEEARLLRSIPATYGTYAVFGNHEIYAGLRNSRSFIRRSGLTLLENAADASGPITIVGINDPQVANFADGRQPDVPALLAELDRERFTLLLKHQPIFQNGEAGLFDLQLSGHTHGGQIWPGRHIVRKIYGFSQGLHTLKGETGESLLYLMNGAGYWGPPMRLLARPEIAVFEIRAVAL